MSKKLYAMISAIVSAVGAIAVAIVTYVNPGNAGIINAAIVVAVGAINEILFKFVKEDEPVKAEKKEESKAAEKEEKPKNV